MIPWAKLRLSRFLINAQDSIAFHILEYLFDTAWPEDHDLARSRFGAETEMRAKII